MNLLCTPSTGSRHPASTFYRLPNTNTSQPAGSTGTASDKGAEEVISADNFKVMEMDPVSVQEQTATFKEEASTYSVNIAAPRDSTFSDGYSDNVPLGQFLARPVLIQDGTWNTNFSTSTDFKFFDPWVLWQSDARVKAKLQNFAYGSWDLKLRFVVNGSPFQYGRNMIVYVPYGDAQQNTSTARNQTAMAMLNWGDAGNGTTDGSNEAMFRHFSTYPHAFLNPSSNQVVEMTLPFIWHNNYISLNGTKGSTKESLGRILMFDINPLRIANVNAPQLVRFNVYAWAENIKLTMPTEFVPTGAFGSSICDCIGRDKEEEEYQFLTSEYEFSPTSDEYNDGPVSTMASAIAAAAGKLSNAPIIGPFARATEIGASSAGNIAALFGFSSPAMVQNPDRFLARSHGRLANSSGEDSCYSLALDPKQEVTVDPRTVGVYPSDEMAISSIVTREQWLARADWRGQFGQFATAGATEVLFASLVSPNQQHHSTVGTHRCHMDTPAGHVANMFEFWKGSITYRVEVVCTPYHSGRLKLQFDPFVKHGSLNAGDAFTNDVNARYTTIMDLSEETSTEFTIDYNSRYPWLRCLQNPTAENQFAPASTSQNTFDLVSHFDDKVHMGIFVISVVNDLVAPIETNSQADATHAPVQINVYFKCGDDMQFAQPNEVSTSWSVAKFEPTSDTDEHTIIGNKVDDHNSSIFFGESISSIRSLIKRYSLVFTGDYNNDARNNNFEMVTRYIPHIPAQVTSGKARRNSFLTYMSPCYLLGRGSTRYKFSYYDKGASPNGIANSYQWFERQGLRSPIGTVGHSVQDTTTMGSAALDVAIPHGYQGAAYTDNTQQSTLEVQLPFYSNTRYFLTSHFMNVANDQNESLILNPSMTQILAGRHVYTGVDAHANVMQQWFSAGDDFSLHFFLGVPGTFTPTSESAESLMSFTATSLNTVSLISDGGCESAMSREVYTTNGYLDPVPIAWDYTYISYFSYRDIFDTLGWNTENSIPSAAVWGSQISGPLGGLTTKDPIEVAAVYRQLKTKGHMHSFIRDILTLIYRQVEPGDYEHWNTTSIMWPDVSEYLISLGFTYNDWITMVIQHVLSSDDFARIPILRVVCFFRRELQKTSDTTRAKVPAFNEWFRARYRYPRTIGQELNKAFNDDDPESWKNIKLSMTELNTINGSPPVNADMDNFEWQHYLHADQSYTIAHLKRFLTEIASFNGGTGSRWGDALNARVLKAYNYN